MATQKVFQFNRLPIEIQCNLFSYLDQKNLKAFRLVSKGCHSIVRNTELCKFESCTLSDTTCKDVLASELIVSWVLIEHLKTKIGISSTRGAIVANASRIVIGRSVNPDNVKKILGTCFHLIHLGLGNMEEICFDATFLSKNNFEFVTKLTITTQLHCGITKIEVANFKKLSRYRTFPVLKYFIVNWTLGQENLQDVPMISLNSSEKVNMLFSIYMSIHAILWNHRATITDIWWNLSGFRLQVPPNMTGQTGEYYTVLKFLMSKEINLKEVFIHKHLEEGGIGFDLSHEMLYAQKALRKVTFSHDMQMHQHVNNILFMPVAEPIHNSRSSLEEVIIKTDMLPLSVFVDCSALKRVGICTKLLVIADTVVFTQLTHLYLDIKIKTIQANGLDSMRWIYEDMPELVVLEMLYRKMYTIPTASTFLKFFNPTKMQKLLFKFIAKTPLSKTFIQERFNEVVELCGSTRGVSIGWTITPESIVNKEMYELLCLVDRKIFTGFNV